MRVGEARRRRSGRRGRRARSRRRAVALAHVDAAARCVRRRSRARVPEASVGRLCARCRPRGSPPEGSYDRRSVPADAVLPPPPPHGDRAAVIAALQAGLRARRARRGADRAVGRPRLPERHGAERAPRSCPRRASRCCSCAATSSARAPRARCAAIEPFTSLRALPRGARLDRPRPGRLRLGLELDVLPGRRPTCATRRCCPSAELGDCMPASVVGALAQERVGARRASARPASRAQARHASTRRSCSCRAACECDVLSELGHHMRAARPRGHDPLPRHQQRVLLRAGAGRAERRRAGPDRDAAARPGLSTAQGRGPSRRPLRAGDAVVVDISGLAEGYVSDQTRTFFLGRADPRAARGLRDLPRDPARRAWSCSCPGTPASALYERGARGGGRGRAAPSTSWARATAACASSATASASSSTSRPSLARGYEQPLGTGTSSRSSPSSRSRASAPSGVENSYFVRRRRPRAADARRRRPSRLVEA